MYPCIIYEINVHIKCLELILLVSVLIVLPPGMFRWLALGCLVAPSRGLWPGMQLQFIVFISVKDPDSFVSAGFHSVFPHIYSVARCMSL